MQQQVSLYIHIEVTDGQLQQKGKAGKLFYCFVNFKKAFDTVLYAVVSSCGRCCKTLVSMGPQNLQVSVCTRQRISMAFAKTVCLLQTPDGVR